MQQSLPCRSQGSCQRRIQPVQKIHQHRRRQQGAAQIRNGLLDSFTGLLSSGKTAQTAAAEVRLLQAIQGTDRGLSASAAQRAAILEAVDELEELGRGSVTTSDSVSATWRLLWTTEKETLFILKNAGWFGTTAGEVFQVIDVASGSLNNVITFPPDGAFIVDSSLDVEGEQRLNFKFSGAKLKLPSRTVSLPPFGQGWFDTVYLGSKLRVAKDIRGDTLVVERDGAPRSFD